MFNKPHCLFVFSFSPPNVRHPFFFQSFQKVARVTLNVCAIELEDKRFFRWDDVGNGPNGFTFQSEFVCQSIGSIISFLFRSLLISVRGDMLNWDLFSSEFRTAEVEPGPTWARIRFLSERTPLDRAPMVAMESILSIRVRPAGHAFKTTAAAASSAMKLLPSARTVSPPDQRGWFCSFVMKMPLPELNGFHGLTLIHLCKQ